MGRRFLHLQGAGLHSAGRQRKLPRTPAALDIPGNQHIHVLLAYCTPTGVVAGDMVSQVHFLDYVGLRHLISVLVAR